MTSEPLSFPTVRCFLDHHGFRRADVAPLPPTLGDYLEQDVQASTQFADELIELIDQVASGSLQHWEGTGNAFLLVLAPEAASIECLWAEERCKVSLVDLRKAVAEWRAFIGDRPPS